MAPKIQASVLASKCSNRKVYGVRVEYINGDWLRTWAFPLSEMMMKSEGYDENKMQGSFASTNEYPGCPYCGAKNFFSCGRCGKMNCNDHTKEIVSCGWCGNIGRLYSQNKFEFGGNAF